MSDTRNGGHAAVEALVDGGVEVVFGIPASHVIELYDGLARTRAVRTVVGRNEQNCVYMADGYARRARRAGVTVVTGGPGLGHTVTGLQTAYADSSPTVVIASDLDPAQRAAVPAGVPHETVDSGQLAVATGAHLFRADAPAEVRPAVAATIAAAEAWGRHRPAVTLLSRGALVGAVPADPDPGRPAASHGALARPPAPEGASSTPPDGATPGPTPTGVPGRTPPPVPPETVARVWRLLSGARAPIVLAGAGVYWADASAELAELLRRTGLRCVTTAPARMVLADHHPQWAGVVTDQAGRALLAEADVVLAVGTGFGAATTGNGALRLGPGLIHVDADPHEIGRCYQPAVGLVADAREFLSALLAAAPALPEAGLPAAGRDLPRLSRPQHAWVDALSAAIPAPSTVVGDVSTTLRWLISSLRSGPDRRLLMPWNYMGMGWGYPAALGVQAAAPEEPVVAVMGDGGALFCLGELATAVENALPVCLVVVNNHSYGVIAELQDDECGGRRFGVELRTPDFAAVARGFGMRACTVRSPGELATAVRAALADREPALVEAMVDDRAFGR